MHKKLFIPGPTHVRDKILRAQAAPMLGHRSSDYSQLHSEVTRKLQKLLYTGQRVYLYASSSTGVMEGAVRQADDLGVVDQIMIELDAHLDPRTRCDQSEELKRKSFRPAPFWLKNCPKTSRSGPRDRVMRAPPCGASYRPASSCVKGW